MKPKIYFELESERERFCLRYMNNLQASDRPIVDMLLECAGRSRVTKLAIIDSLQTELQIFSSEALHHFLTVNDELKTLDFRGMRLDADVCVQIGRIPKDLDSLYLSQCELSNMQLLANIVGANSGGPTKLNLSYCQKQSGWDGADFSTIIAPLISNPRLKQLSFYGMAIPSGNLQAVNDALVSSQSLEDLCIFRAPQMEDVGELLLLLQGIATAPNLRSVGLRRTSGNLYLPARQQSAMFANVLYQCQNKTLECFHGTFCVGYSNDCDAVTWNRDVILVFQFNSSRHLFKKVQGAKLKVGMHTSCKRS
jgi:hypothetical protein